MDDLQKEPLSQGEEGQEPVLDTEADDMTIESEEGGTGPGALKKLREKLAKAVAEKQEYLDGWQRARAEFTNYQKGESDRAREVRERASEQLIEGLLPTFDAFDAAFAAPAFQEASEQLKQGFQAVHGSLDRALADLGVTRFVPTVGEPFDPRRHEALREVPTENPAQDHTVEGVIRTGYSIGERVIRPAYVSVYTHQKAV